MTQRAPFAPVVLFVYKRPEHTHRTLTTLAANELAAESELIVFSDAPKSRADRLAVNNVRELVRDAKGFATLRIVERETNFGLAASIIDGVTQALAAHNEVIVLEDDMVTSRYFLRYMNNALRTYRHDEGVASIHAYCPPIRAKLPQAFFLRGADCWGWGTWRRAWQHFNADSRQLLNELMLRNLTHLFDFNGAYPYTQMLVDHVEGRNDSWAIRWHAATFLQGMLTLHPGESYVHNIGLDGSGEHCGKSADWGGQVATSLPEICKQPIEEDFAARAEFARHYADLMKNGFVSKLLRLVPVARRFIASLAVRSKC